MPETEALPQGVLDGIIERLIGSILPELAAKAIDALIAWLKGLDWDAIALWLKTAISGLVTR